MENIKSTVTFTITKQAGERAYVYKAGSHASYYEAEATEVSDFTFIDRILSDHVTRGYRFVQPLPFDWSILLKEEYVIKVMMYLPEPEPKKK